MKNIYAIRVEYLSNSFVYEFVVLKRTVLFLFDCFRNVYERRKIYLELVYLVTAFVPSLTACLASSPGSSNLTAV